MFTGGLLRSSGGKEPASTKHCVQGLVLGQGSSNTDFHLAKQSRSYVRDDESGFRVVRNDQEKTYICATAGMPFCRDVTLTCIAAPAAVALFRTTRFLDYVDRP
jgi:hypothetical protein